MVKDKTEPRGNLFALTAVALGILIALGCATAPRDPQTVVMLIESSPLNLDPRIGTDAQSARIGALIFDSLLRRDRGSNIHPWLAESWESPDPVTYVFHLRPGVRFHNGKPLTARDVQYTFQSLLSGELQSIKSATFSRIASIEASDDFTVVFRLNEPHASFLFNLTQASIGIVPEDSGGELAQQPIGSGPFRFVRAVQDEDVVIERNPDYWASPPQIARVEFRVVPDMTTRALEMRKGSADVTLNSLSADMVETLSREEHIEVTDAPGPSYQYIALNLEAPSLTLPVRQAIAHAVNREAIITHLWRNTVRPANSILPPEHWAYAPDLTPYAYDPEKAALLLDQAGLHPGPDGVRIRLEMKTSTDQGARDLASVLQQQLREVGIALEIRSFEFATFYADIIRGSFELYSLRWVAGNDDPDIFEFCFHSQSIPPRGANRGRYRNAEVDRLIEEARVSSDQEARRRNYHLVQQIVHHDLPYVHLWYVNDVAVFNRRIEGLGLEKGNYDFLTHVQVADDTGG